MRPHTGITKSGHLVLLKLRYYWWGISVIWLRKERWVRVRCKRSCKTTRRWSISRLAPRLQSTLSRRFIKSRECWLSVRLGTRNHRERGGLRMVRQNWKGRSSRVDTIAATDLLIWCLLTEYYQHQERNTVGLDSSIIMNMYPFYSSLAIQLF